MEEALKALAHPQRRALLQLVMERPRAAGELAQATGMRQPTASQHLRVLRDAELVEVEARGTQRLYRVNFEKAQALRSFLDAFWGEHLDRLSQAAEEVARPARRRSNRRSRSGRR